MPILLLDNVDKVFRRGQVTVRAVDRVSLAIDSGEALGLIGESGSGKSTVGRLALGLLRPDNGRVVFDGSDLQELPAAVLRKLRGRFQIVFQEPLQSLNPRMTVGSLVEEPLIVHGRGMSRTQRRGAVRDVFEQVGLDPGYVSRYPAQLSGGQQQRVNIARAIISRPDLIVLDEPTSSLDLSVRALILNVLSDLQAKLKLTYLFISHDIATVRYFCSRTAVMYRGQIVELGPTSMVLRSPVHPYTQALVSAGLSVDPNDRPAYVGLTGDPPSPTLAFPGCPLAGRCPVEIAECSQHPIPMVEVAAGHKVACVWANGAEGSDSKDVRM